MVSKVGCLGFKLDDAFGGANGNKVVTKLGPNVLLIKTNEEVCAMVQPCVKANRVPLTLFFLSSRWHGSVRRINASGNEGDTTVPFDSFCIRSLLTLFTCLYHLLFGMQAGSA